MEFFDSLAGIRFGSISLSTILSALVVVAICYVVKGIVNKIFASIMEKSSLDGSLKSFLKTAVNVGIWAFIVVIVAGTLGIPTASLVAALSVAGLALSLSVQGILGNLFSGMIMMGTRPFHDGDLVDIGGTTGVVQSLGLFYTVIVTADKRTVHIPNSTVAGSSVLNYSTAPQRRIDLVITASYDDSAEKVKKALYEACADANGILADPAPAVVVSEYGASSIAYTVMAWADNADFLSAKGDLMEKVRTSFEKNGVTMTYDHLNVHIVEK